MKVARYVGRYKEIVMSNQYDYDAIIIGAGIGGLVCGCYLAKAGFYWERFLK